MKYVIDEVGDLGYMLNGERQSCMCPKMTRGIKKDQFMFCGLDCPFFSLSGGFGGILPHAELSCSSIKKVIQIAAVAENVEKEMGGNQ